MNSAIYFTLVLCLVSTKVLIPADAIRAVIPNRCPNICSRNVEGIFFNCIAEVDNGCALRICDKFLGFAKCTLKSGVPDRVVTGETVTLFDAEVSTPLVTNISIEGITPKIDVYFLIDVTGSMERPLSAFQKAFMQLTTALSDIGDFGLGVGIFRDETELNMGFRHRQSITEDVNLVKTQVDVIEADGGKDSEEANLVALYKLATGGFVNWRDGAARVILLFGDAVGHEPTCFDDVVLNRRVVTDALNDANIVVHVLGTESSTLNARTVEFGCGNGTAPPGQSSFIAKNTGGAFQQIARDSVATILTDFPGILSGTGANIRLAKSTCGEGIEFVFDPELPALLRVSQSLRATIKLKKGVCRKRRFRCSIRFALGDSMSDPLTLNFEKIGGCH